MNLKLILFVSALLLSLTLVNAQKNKKEQEINNVVLGYINNFFENNEEEMLKYLHPKLAKRGISFSKEKSSLFFDDMSMDRLTNMLQKKRSLEISKQKNEVQVLDIFENTASARLNTGYPGKMRWVEYIHLCKLDNKWLIVNIIWDYYPRRQKS